MGRDFSQMIVTILKGGEPGKFIGTYMNTGNTAGCHPGKSGQRSTGHK